MDVNADADFTPDELFCSQRSKKNKNRNGIYVEVKLKPRVGKCVGLTSLAKEPKNDSPKSIVPYSIISDDVWYCISHHIPPESIQSFASICTQTAALVRTHQFWWNLYKRYCNARPNKWNLLLPERLQYEYLQRYDLIVLRSQVIKALYFCYQPFLGRLCDSYSIQNLIGNTYVTSWVIRRTCEWITCYRFWNRVTYKIENKNCSVPAASVQKEEHVEISDWEQLADNPPVEMKDSTQTLLQHTNPDEGVWLLLIIGSFIPLPTQLVRSSHVDDIRLAGFRQTFSSSTNSYFLELDFAYNCQKSKYTFKYPDVRRCLVLPWWHPRFR